MFQCVCAMGAEEYASWVAEPSTAGEVLLFSTPGVDASLRDARAWGVLAAVSLWRSTGLAWASSLVALEQVLVALVAVMAVNLAALAGEHAHTLSLRMPPGVHFLFFGLTHKYRYSCWKHSSIPAAAVAALCLVAGYPLASAGLCAVHGLFAHRAAQQTSSASTSA